MIYSSVVCHIEYIVNLYIHVHKTCCDKKCECFKIIKKTFHHCTADRDNQEAVVRRHYDKSKMVNDVHFLLKVFLKTEIKNFKFSKDKKKIADAFLNQLFSEINKRHQTLFFA